MGRPHTARAQWGALIGLLLLLAVLALASTQVTARLIPTMGLVVLAAGLFLPPRMTALVAVAAIGLGIPVALGLDEDFTAVRMLNLVVASVLAVVASWFLQRRLDRIEQLASRQASILASIPDAVVELDARGTLLQANAGVSRLIPGAAVGEPLHPRLGHVLADGSPCPGQCALAGLDPGRNQHIPVEGERVTRDGQLVPVAYTYGLMPEGGIVVSVRDVTTRVRAEHDRRILLEEAVRQQEQTQLLRALEPPDHHALAEVVGLTSDIWSVGAHGGAAGSDLADVSTLPDGRALFLLVDSDGQGLHARRDSWMVLHACRAHMAGGAPLGQMIALTSETLAWAEETPRACVLGVIVDPATGHVQAVSGGCPPPLLVSANGATQWIDAAGGGLGSAPSGSHSVMSAELNPGDTLVLFSDGAIDSSHDVVEGLAAMRSIAVALRNKPAAGWSRRLLSSIQGDTSPPVDATAIMVRLGGGS